MMNHGCPVRQEVLNSVLLIRAPQRFGRSSSGFWFLVMDPLWVVLPVFLMSFSKAQNPQEVKGELGQSATLNCSVNISDVYWYMEVSSGIRVQVARTFTPDPNEAQYCWAPLKDKYLAKGKQLVVSNISAQDLRLYSCSTLQKETITEVDAFQLLRAGPDGPDVPDAGVTRCSNASETNQQQNMCRICQNQVLVYASLVLNVFLVSVTTGLVSALLCLKRRCSSQVSDPPPLTCDDPETLEMPQYEEIQIRDPPPAAPPLECIYYKAQLPQHLEDT